MLTTYGERKEKSNVDPQVVKSIQCCKVSLIRSCLEETSIQVRDKLLMFGGKARVEMDARERKARVEMGARERKAREEYIFREVKSQGQVRHGIEQRHFNSCYKGAMEDSSCSLKRWFSH